MRKNAILADAIIIYTNTYGIRITNATHQENRHEINSLEKEMIGRPEKDGFV